MLPRERASLAAYVPAGEGEVLMGDQEIASFVLNTRRAISAPRPIVRQ
jgi:hypothetical protein